MIKVTPRARRNDDRAGDPLDGLVNLFDVGIVLAVAFLLAGLSSLHLSSAFTKKGLQAPAGNTITVKPGQKTGTVESTKGRVIGNGSQVGKVYRLSDGTLVYVTDGSNASPTAVPSATPTP